MATEDMASPPPEVNNLDIVYKQNPDLLRRIRAAIADQPPLETLFLDISHFHFQRRFEPSSDANGSKRRKLDNGAYTSSESLNGTSSHDMKKTILLEIKDVSFSIPQRKKMHLAIAHHGDRLTSPDTFAIWIMDPSTGNVLVETPISSFAHAFCLPVPERPQKSYNYCFLPRSASKTEPIVFTLPAGPINNSTRSKEWDLALAPPTDENPLNDILNSVLAHHHISLIKPDAAQFTSFFPEPQRRTEKAYHVKANRGTKDGYLFFLSTGIFFGFKKPLVFLPLEAIESTSVVSAVTKTFGLAIAYREEGKDESEEVQFEHIDTQEYGAINEYIQRHHLVDGSFAEARKAKLVKAKEKGGQQNGETGGGDNDGMTELEKAEQELQDQEDEEEEDYDPEAEVSESGSESDGGEEYTNGKGKDLVGDELGSEAEDVSDDEEEEEAEGEDEDMEDADDPEVSGEEEEEEQVVEMKVKTIPERTPAPMPAILTASNRARREPDPEDDDQL